MTWHQLRTAALLPALALAAACSPTLDWREFVAEGTDLRVTFPCRPDSQARPVALADMKFRMEMLACSAGGMTFAVSFADLAEPNQVGSALGALRRAAIGNLQGGTTADALFVLNGMTPNDRSRRVSLTGKLPDGTVVHEESAFFARGLRIYQASVIGTDPAPQAIETFFGGLKFSS